MAPPGSLGPGGVEAGDAQSLSSMASTDRDDRALIVDEEEEARLSDVAAHGPTGTSSMPEASFNLINSIVGAGIIGIPFAIREAGFAVGIILIILVGFLTDYSIILVVGSSVECDRPSYQDLVTHTLGKWGYRVLNFAQFVFPFAAMIAYSIIVGQTIPRICDQAMGESFLSDRHPTIVLMTFGVMLPLALNLVGSQLEEAPDRGDPTGSFIRPKVFQAIGVASFAFVCHHNVHLVYASLRDRTMQNFSNVVHSSIGVSLSFIFALGVGGYLIFGDSTKADVLDNFDEKDTVANIARGFFAMTIMLTYPLEAIVVREVLFNSILREEEGRETPIWKVNLTTFCLSMVAMFVALATDDLGLVLELTGTIGASLIAYILPGLCAICLTPGVLFQRKKIGPLLLTVFGVIVLFVGTIVSIVDASS